MYLEGVRNEQLLFVKMKADDTEFINREYIGGTTSFFNKDKDEKSKKEFEKIEAQTKLNEE